MAKDQTPGRKMVARNRRATHDYFIDERFEAGLMLVGTEVKSLRDGRATINEAYAAEQGGEIFLINATISEYRGGNRFNHEPRRPRKLLLKRKEMNKLAGAVKRKGQTIIPLALYFNPRGLAKLEIGLARGKSTVDKRHSIKDRDWQREKEQLFKKNLRAD
ncbi:MAG: SsrA-binding protein SmpB [Geminicoccaceae bacterium]